MREAALDFVQLLIGGYRLGGRQIPFLGLNDVFAFQRLLPHQGEGMLKKTKLPLTQLPGKITMTMMAAQTRGGRSPNLVRLFNSPFSTCALNASSSLRARSIANTRRLRSYTSRSSLGTTNPRTPASFPATSTTLVLGVTAFSAAAIPTAHSCQSVRASACCIYSNVSLRLRRCSPTK